MIKLLNLHDFVYLMILSFDLKLLDSYQTFILCQL